MFLWVSDTTTSPPWTPLYPGSSLEQQAIQYIHKFYCKDCQMDQQAADIAKAVAAGSTGEESNMSFCGSGDSAGGSAVEVKQEPPSPMSPQQTTDEASLMVTLDKNKESLKRKLMMRRSLHELVDQGIYPSPKIPIAFVEQKKSLERAKIGDSLRFKISHRPDRQQLVQQHILEDTNVNVDPSLHERQRQLKKARLADSLNDKLSHRPGVLELVQGNILQTDGKLGQLIKEGSLSFDLEGDAYSYDAAYEDSRSSDDALSPDFTDDSNLSDISSPPAIPPAPELPTSFAKSLGFPAQITFAHDSKVTFSQSTSAFTIPNQTANSTGLSFSGAFSGTGFYTPRNNVTVNTINNNKIKPKKPKPKPPTKAKVIKFHEYKGPPNVVKSTAPVLSTSMPVLGNPATVNSAPVEQKPDPANHSDTPYNILLQQQQLYLQWQLEINQKNLNATVIVPTQKEGQPALVSPTIAASGGFTVGTSVAESPPVSVATKTPTHTVFTVTPTNQHAQPPAQIQQIRIASPGLAQVKSEPQVGQPSHR
ncbi:MRTFB-like protein [Mya arenaria]|uniref:MRTFB-like protein n=1 Tax=Mya arenaria TaxID=6604 RepID=A0ABY7DDF3_MYAAR|nr:MRTFB-like protein [Mya arenaria]